MWTNASINAALIILVASFLTMALAGLVLTVRHQRVTLLLALSLPTAAAKRLNDFYKIAEKELIEIQDGEFADDYLFDDDEIPGSSNQDQNYNNRAPVQDFPLERRTRNEMHQPNAKSDKALSNATLLDGMQIGDPKVTVTTCDERLLSVAGRLQPIEVHEPSDTRLGVRFSRRRSVGNSSVLDSEVCCHSITKKGAHGADGALEALSLTEENVARHASSPQRQHPLGCHLLAQARLISKLQGATGDVAVPAQSESENNGPNMTNPEQHLVDVAASVPVVLLPDGKPNLSQCCSEEGERKEVEEIESSGDHLYNSRRVGDTLSRCADDLVELCTIDTTSLAADLHSVAKEGQIDLVLSGSSSDALKMFDSLEASHQKRFKRKLSRARLSLRGSPFPNLKPSSRFIRAGERTRTPPLLQTEGRIRPMPETSDRKTSIEMGRFGSGSNLLGDGTLLEGVLEARMVTRLPWHSTRTAHALALGMMLALSLLSTLYPARNIDALVSARCRMPEKLQNDRWTRLPIYPD